MPDDPKTSPVVTEAPAAPIVQPVQQWESQPPVGAHVQYVVAHHSVEGLGGWLMFWLVVFALAGLSFTTSFFTQLGVGASDANGVAYLVFAPLMGIAYLASVVFIAMRKKLARLLAILAIGLSTLYAVVSSVIDMTANTSGNFSSEIGGLVGVLISGGLIALYFVVSKRVKATLVN